ncbi:MAG: MCP four helix bundle domain-containing protein [Bdellovibrio sp.]|nr:MCP four helix bundle domain-containing protein [Bdellovibrio sp.]
MAVSSWFRGIKGRLLAAAVIPVVGFGIVFSISHGGFNKLNDVIDSAHGDIIPNIVALAEMRQARNKFGYQVWEYMNAADSDAKQSAAKGVATSIEEYETNYKAYTSSTFSPEEKAAFEKVKDDFPKLIGAMKDVGDLVATGSPEKHDAIKAKLRGEIASLGKTAGDFTRATALNYVKRGEVESKEADATRESVSTWLISTTLVCCSVIFGALMILASVVSRSVASIADRLTSAGGNVASSVEQLNEAGNSLSQSSTEAAASLEETVAALEELSSMVQMNSDNAKQAAALSISSREAAETGESEIKNLISSMGEISQSSKKIEEIISVIDDIAFQTNLLALNAAVEAARAGEQGKGFAVVAEAVRALAQRSASSAKDISSLIKDSVSQIENGSDIADKSGTVLSNIVNSIKKVSDLNNEIAAASSEQTTGIQQISKAMNQLDQASQSNAASAEEIAATSGEINNLATTALNLTIELNNVVLGQNSDMTSNPTPTASHKAPPAAKKKNNVVPLRAAAPVKHKTASASDMIPFEDDNRAKVGTTDGF